MERFLLWAPYNEASKSTGGTIISGREIEQLREEFESLRVSIATLNTNFAALFPLYAKYIAVLQDFLAKWQYGFVLTKNDIVFADPHGTWDGHLDGAYAEGEWIKTILEGQGHNVTLKRHPVSKSTFLNNLASKYIVHLAGHGGYSSSTGQCYFCFDDADVYPSDVNALSSVPSKLFYAGVCLGGKNDTMAKAFIDKGTDMYVGFQTTIPDWGAAHFDKLVYEKWLVDGKDLRTALDEADDLYPGCNSWVLWGA